MKKHFLAFPIALAVEKLGKTTSGAAEQFTTKVVTMTPALLLGNELPEFNFGATSSFRFHMSAFNLAVIVVDLPDNVDSISVSSSSGRYPSVLVPAGADGATTTTATSTVWYEDQRVLMGIAGGLVAGKLL